MKVFYYCYGSAHSSVISAAIHTGMLNPTLIPSSDEIINLPHYDKTSNPEIGTAFFFGYDKMDNEIYIIGMKSEKEIVLQSIQSLLQNVGIPGTNYIFINTLTHVNFITRIGGFLSRKLGLIFPGRLFTVYGLQRSYFSFVKMVKQTKFNLKHFQD